MKTVTLSVDSREDFNRRALSAFAGHRQGARISFASVDLLWQTLTRERWDILRAMAGKGPVSIGEAARLVDRDVEPVHGDIAALTTAGILDETEEGVVFPFDAVHVDFELTAA